MSAGTLWLVYLLVAFVLVPAAFVARYRRSPIVASVPPKDAYAWVEALYAGAVALSSVLLLTMPECPLHGRFGAVIGAAIFLLAAGLILWAVVDMGPHWRLGQDREDETTRRVRTPLFRALRHPIYVGLVLLAVGLVLMAGPNPGTLLLLITTSAYVALQSRAEARHWAARTAQ